MNKKLQDEINKQAKIYAKAVKVIAACIGKGLGADTTYEEDAVYIIVKLGNEGLLICTEDEIGK